MTRDVRTDEEVVVLAKIRRLLKLLRMLQAMREMRK